MFEDPITRAYAREREARRVVWPEDLAVFKSLFRCVCCGKVRPGEMRREPRSEVCMQCVGEVGFWN